MVGLESSLRCIRQCTLSLKLHDKTDIMTTANPTAIPKDGARTGRPQASSAREPDANHTGKSLSSVSPESQHHLVLMEIRKTRSRATESNARPSE